MSKFPSLGPETIQFLEEWPLFDNAIIEHGFAGHMRDYDVLVAATAAGPDGGSSYVEGHYRLRFTHCVVANTATSVGDEIWRMSWQDDFIDYDAWLRVGEPEGYVWGVNWMLAYPGGTYARNSTLAGDWSRRLGRAMHEVVIETNAHNLQLVFHELRVYKVAEGDPATRKVRPIDPEEISSTAA